MSAGYRSIGEVLSLLSSEHPELTISKIRFLESQGLIAPQRTPSGYRKFFEADIERLDWVLTQQRDHFLPLKEIKRRIAAGAVTSRLARGAAPLEDPVPQTPSLFSRKRPEPEPGTPEPQGSQGVNANVTATAPDLQGSVSMSATELANATGTDADFIAELRRVGLIAPVSHAGAGGEPAYDHEALLTSRIAAAFAARGLPARVLRMFKVSADREAGVYDQLLATLRARGDTDRLRTELTEIVDLAESLRRRLLRRLMHPHLD